MTSSQTIFSIITPSFNQLNWLRLCVASVRDQVAAGSGGILNSECCRVDQKIQLQSLSHVRSAFQKSKIQNQKSKIPHLAVEHIIQDAGTPGIEEFAREIGADFYRDGVLQFYGINAISGPNSANQSKSNCSGFDGAKTAGLSIQNLNSNYRIAIYCERDEGMYDAINRGFSRATGEFLAYLNCDEQYLSGTLQSVVSFFSAHVNLDVVFGDVIIIDESGNGLAYRRAILPTINLMRSGPLGVLTCGTYLRKKTVLEKAIYFDSDLKIAGDYKWYAKIIREGLIMGRLRSPTSAFTLLPSNMSQSDSAILENDKWDTEGRKLAPCFKIFHLTCYGIKKLCEGCYIPRKTECSVFVGVNKNCRSSHIKQWLSDYWPKWARKDLCKKF